MRTVLTLTAVAAAALAIGGCAKKDTSSVSFDAITSDLTPELAGLTYRPDDIDRHIAVTNNQNKRMFNDDLMRTFYLDHPSRLTPFNITYTSGMPR